MAGVVLKLINETNTPYVWNYWPGKLDEMFTRLPDSTVIDLTRCRFDPQCVNVIDKHCARLEFINSTEPELDAILRHNRRVALNSSANKEINRLDLPYRIVRGKFELKDIFDTVKHSPQDVIWRMPSNMPTEYVSSATAIFATLLMNFIKRRFDTNPSGVSMTRLVSYFKTKMRDVDYTECSRFYWLRGDSGFAILDFHEQSTVHFAGYGYISKDSLRKLNVLPYWVGNESPRGDINHKRIADSILLDIKTDEEIAEVQQPVTINDFIRKYGS